MKLPSLPLEIARRMWLTYIPHPTLSNWTADIQKNSQSRPHREGFPLVSCLITSHDFTFRRPRHLPEPTVSIVLVFFSGALLFLSVHRRPPLCFDKGCRSSDFVFHLLPPFLNIFGCVWEWRRRCTQSSVGALPRNVVAVACTGEFS